MRSTYAMAACGIVFTGCALVGSPKPKQEAANALPALSEKRLNDVQKDAPELAAQLARLQHIAQHFAAAGDTQIATELAYLAQVTLLSSSEVLARLHTAELRQNPDAIAAPHVDPSKPTEHSEPHLAAVREKRRNTANKLTDGSDKQPSATTKMSKDKKVSERLAHLANQLSSLQGDEQRAVVENIQTTLIAGDRALADGLPQRAAQLADAAELLIASLTGQPAPVPQAKGGLFDDAQEKLGEHAQVHQGAVFVRLDSLLTWEKGAWKLESTNVTDDIKAVVRAYRSASVFLTTVGSPSSEAFRNQGDALLSYMADRLQIDTKRLRWSKADYRMSTDGTYLVLKPGKDRT